MLTKCLREESRSTIEERQTKAYQLLNVKIQFWLSIMTRSTYKIIKCQDICEFKYDSSSFKDHCNFEQEKIQDDEMILYNFENKYLFVVLDKQKKIFSNQEGFFVSFDDKTFFIPKEFDVFFFRLHTAVVFSYKRGFIPDRIIFPVSDYINILYQMQNNKYDLSNFSFQFSLLNLFTLYWYNDGKQISIFNSFYEVI
jgi:hypothetical protein